MAAAAKELPACPVETTLTLISDKWKVLILRDLMPGTKRFGELKKSIGSVSQKVLTAQLREMERSGLLTRTVYPEVPPRVEYTLTDLGYSLKPILDVTVGNFSNLEILWGDVLKQDIPALVKEKFGALRPMACANLPYYITSPILTALLEAECFQSVTVMVQKEVAQRIAAKPGTPDYSAFTVFCQYYAEPELLFDVPAHCFLPQPKVTSAVITLRTRQKRPWEIADEAVFFRAVRASFAMRRKKLANGLSSGFPELGKAGAEAVIAAAGFDANVRGETLGIPEFARIANEIVRRKEENRA